MTTKTNATTAAEAAAATITTILAYTHTTEECWKSPGNTKTCISDVSTHLTNSKRQLPLATIIIAAAAAESEATITIAETAGPKQFATAEGHPPTVPPAPLAPRNPFQERYILRFMHIVYEFSRTKTLPMGRKGKVARRVHWEKFYSKNIFIYNF